VHAVGNMAVVYNSCYGDQATVNSRVWRKQNGGRDVNNMARVVNMTCYEDYVNKMADARAVNIMWPQQWAGYAI
jgi:hypothetical protein